jgi:NAD(P)-dependent dehydrogenase (short-subunit alcohol dehydrogenase family)
LNTVPQSKYLRIRKIDTQRPLSKRHKGNADNIFGDDVMIITSMKDAFFVKGKTIVVTGGNKGIGFGISTAFAEQGANVAIIARDESSGLSAISRLTDEYNGIFRFYKADITDMSECNDSINKIIKDYKQIDVLVNNAGTTPNGDLLDMDNELSEYFKCIDADLNGVVRMTYLAGKHMRDRGKGGRIINISSNSAVMANRLINLAPYCTAKAGVNQFTRAMALELAKFNIQINAIAPGYTWSEVMAGLDETTRKGMAGVTPDGRLGTPFEVGALAVFLASAAASHITGDIITIDGGHSLGIY